MKTRIKEVFSSIQGEGPYIGYKQLFIRFCGCNLKCSYCDTDFDTKLSQEYTPQELAEIVNKNSDCHSISLTGGEPLLNESFLKAFLPLCKLPVYLETNATLPDKLIPVIEYIDIISADIKLPSCTGNNELWDLHDKFFNIAKHKNLFAKIVFNKNITDSEINSAAELGNKYNIVLVLQPQMSGIQPVIDKEFMELTLDKFLAKYKNVRLVPQVHKFLDIR